MTLLSKADIEKLQAIIKADLQTLKHEHDARFKVIDVKLTLLLIVAVLPALKALGLW